ncbi:MAG: IS4 family transposase [Candidatus Latescibacterota bacterium]
MLPRGFILTDGKANPRDFAPQLVNPGETGILDRGFHCHEDFDRWDEMGLKYVCRIKDNTQKYVVCPYPVTPGGYILSDEVVILGSSEKNYSCRLVRLVIFKAGSKTYWIATNRFDLTAEQVAEVFLLRWSIEIFFGWWKNYMGIYHLISRSKYGLAVQILSSLITYLLLAIYCHEQFGEKVSIQRVRELRHAIRNESMCVVFIYLMPHPLFLHRYAKS